MLPSPCCLQFSLVRGMPPTTLARSAVRSLRQPDCNTAIGLHLREQFHLVVAAQRLLSNHRGLLLPVQLERALPDDATAAARRTRTTTAGARRLLRDHGSL